MEGQYEQNSFSPSKTLNETLVYLYMKQNMYKIKCHRNIYMYVVRARQ